MDQRVLESFGQEWQKIAGLASTVSRGAELLSGSGAKRIANTVKLHGEAAKSLAAKGSTVAELHREAGGLAAKRLATEASKVTGARVAAGGVAAAGAAGAGLAAHKEEPKTAALQDDATTTNNMVDLARRSSGAGWAGKAGLATAIPGAILGGAVGGHYGLGAGKGALLGGAATGAIGAYQGGMAHARAKAYGLGQDAAQKTAEDTKEIAAARAKVKAKYPETVKSAMATEVMAAFAKQAISMDWHSAMHAAKEEAGPALGAIAGAGLAAARGKSTLGGAALGYGAGSLPELLLGGKKK